MKNKLIKNIPNVITFSRIIACLGGIVTFVSGNIPLSLSLYIYGAVSDFFDGFAARKLNAFSEFGRRLDALSDKLYAVSLLIPSIICGNLIMAIPLLLESKISLVILKAEKLGFNPKTQRVGKFKTALLFPTMITGLLSIISMKFYPLLWILLPVTTILQTKTIAVYENLLQYNIRKSGIEKQQKLESIEQLENTYKDDKPKEFKENTCKKVELNTCNRGMNLAEELAFYVMSPYYIQEYDNKLYKPYVKKKIK